MKNWEEELAAWAKTHPIIDYKYDRDEDMEQAMGEVKRIDIGLSTAHNQ